MAEAPNVGPQTTAAAKRVIVGATVGGVTLATVHRARAGDPIRPRVLGGGLVAMIGLTLAAEVAPQPAAVFALVIVTAAVVRLGPDVWQSLAATGGIDTGGGQPTTNGQPSRGRPADPRSPV